MHDLGTDGPMSGCASARRNRRVIGAAAMAVIAAGAAFAALAGQPAPCPYEDAESCRLVETLGKLERLEAKLASLQPPPGDAGPRGDRGNPGPTGPDGTDGVAVPRPELLDGYRLAARMARETSTARFLNDSVERRLADLEYLAGLLDDEATALEADRACAAAAVAASKNPKTECGL